MNPSTSSMTGLFRRNRAGEPVGVFSVCSAHPVVIAAALELCAERKQLALIEATCNQVNQHGGYTGMRPADFAARVRAAAEVAGIGPGQLVLGGDHLGPQPWRKKPAAEAMAEAAAMVDAYVRAGFTKIHLDCSMRCADDPEVLTEATVAGRAARLAQIAESAAAETGTQLLYVIGTEVPPPGGMGAGHEIVPTAPASVAATWAAHEQAFAERGLSSAFARVAAIVVQPGLDFGNEDVVHFAPEAAGALSAALAALPGAVFEAHSTDYQLPAAYRALVAGHFAILKIGPAATFALREALYALESIESELSVARPSQLRATLEAAMLENPADWSGHYAGTEAEQAYLRHFSLSDRSRYYWTGPAVAAAVETLHANLAAPIPYPLVSQYLPQHAEAVAAGTLVATPAALCKANVKRALAPYADACGRHLTAA